MPVHHVLIKAWYDGRGYRGSQFQPGLRTVDGALVDALRETGYIPASGSHVDHLKVAGRTDKGVSALGAVYYIAALRPVHPLEINHALRKAGHPIAAWAVARLPAAVNPRTAIARVYKYVHVMAREHLDTGNIARALHAMTGEHEFKGFTKATIPAGTRTRRTLDVATLDVDGDVLTFTFQSQGFLWEQVRRVVAFLLGNHDAPGLVERVQQVLETGEQPNVEPAPPGGLLLWDVRYGPGITWESVDDSVALFSRQARDRYAEEKARARLAGMIADELGAIARRA